MKDVNLRDGARNAETLLCSTLTPTRRIKAALSCCNTYATLVPVLTSTGEALSELDTRNNPKIKTSPIQGDTETMFKTTSAIRIGSKCPMVVSHHGVKIESPNIDQYVKLKVAPKYMPSLVSFELKET